MIFAAHEVNNIVCLHCNSSPSISLLVTVVLPLKQLQKCSEIVRKQKRYGAKEAQNDPSYL